jgi:CrcB protein
MIAYIAFGSAVGGTARHLIGAVVQSRSTLGFPIGTLIINITGSLLLGFLIRYLTGTGTVTPEFRAMLTTGLCGGYTTFSAFAFESASLMEDGRYGRVALYVASSVVLSILATFGGFALAATVLNARRIA